MKMQIWEVCVSEGVMDAIHGGYQHIYEGFVPDLRLTINHVTSFVHDGEEGEVTRYKPSSKGSKPLVETPDPHLVCEIELSRAQIEDLKILANPDDDPEERVKQIIASALKEHKLDSSDYKD